METPLLCPCEFQLVLVYNPEPGEMFGAEIKPEVLEDIFDGLNKKFGAYTPLAPTGDHQGKWQGQAEPSIRIEVAVPPNRVEEVRQFVVDLGDRLGQRAMYFKAGPPCVEIIDIEQEKRKPAEGAK